MEYIYITYDAIEEFASNRFFQSAEFQEGKSACDLIDGRIPNTWGKSTIICQPTKWGSIAYSNKCNKNRGLLFDLSCFKLSDRGNDVKINIFQKIIKYAIRHFGKQPMTQYYKELPNNKKTIIFPFPFIASKNVEKVIIDRGSTDILSKKGITALIVLYFGTGQNDKMNYNVLKHSADDIKIFYPKKKESDTEHRDVGLDVLKMNSLDLKIKTGLDFDNWTKFLTLTQKEFVESDIEGPERLEGAAGTGKTLSMILRCIFLLKKYLIEEKPFHIIFFTHSLFTKKNIINNFIITWPQVEKFLNKTFAESPQTIQVTTLQEWSAENLGTNSISENEFLDKDAEDAKEYQILYIEQALEQMNSEEEKNAYWGVISQKFKSFLTETDNMTILEMIRQEIGVVIKGRANGDMEKYKNLIRPQNAIQLKNEADYSYMFHLYDLYQKSLESIGQYDTDDIILTALGQVNTPIWSRRRLREGYDACFIDETHLFNLNELSLFHFVNKLDNRNHIVYSMDRSQAVGEWSLTSTDISDSLNVDRTEDKENKFETVFRSSPEITALAFNILSSGATLFTHFENPLEQCTFNFTKEEESKAELPIYKLLLTTNELYEEAFSWVEEYTHRKGLSRADSLIVAVDSNILDGLSKYAEKTKKRALTLKSRSDSTTVNIANQSNQFIIGAIDQVGGLEFDAVVIVGVDGGHVPAKINSDAYHYMNYVWHNRMYVAVTRAKYAILLLGEKTLGISDVMKDAVNSKILMME